MPKPQMIDYMLVKQALIDQGLKVSSAISYCSKIRKVMTTTFGSGLQPISKLRRSHKKIIQSVSGDEYKTPNIKKVYLMAVCHLYEIYDITISPFEKYVRDWSSLADADAVNGTSAEDMVKIGSVDFDQIREQIDETKDPDDRIIKAFYTLLPPLRQQDLINLVVYNNKKDPKRDDVNYLHLPSKKIVINEHKTSKIHGTKFIPLCDRLCDEVRKYLADTKRDVLLPMTSSGFTKRMTRLFGVSSSIFRKAYISKYTVDMSPEELYKTSQIMGHRINTQLVSYRKNLKAAEEEENVKTSSLEAKPDTHYYSMSTPEGSEEGSPRLIPMDE